MTYKIYKAEDLDRPFYIQDFKNSDYLIIAFSGYAQNFEWFGTMRKYENDYKFSKFWLRDVAKAYWHGKLPGINFGVIPLSNFINEKIEESKSQKVMTMGLSMGGYAALLFGCLCNVDLVLSFSGQTYLPEYRRKKYKLYEKWEHIKINENHIDLRLLFNTYNKYNKTKYKLIYGEFYNPDKIYAERLKNERGVELIPVNSSRHNSVSAAMTQGLVEKYIKKFLSS
jgi:hypothetical protein